MSTARIGIWIPNLRIGGAERVALNLAEALCNAGERVDVVVSEEVEGFSVPQVDGLQLVNLQTGSVAASPGALRRYMKEVRPQAMISHLSRCNVVLLLAAAGLRGRPRTIVVEHATPTAASSLKDRVVQFLMRKSYRYADAVVAASDGNARDVEAFVGLRNGSVHKIYNPIVGPHIHAEASRGAEHPWLGAEEWPLFTTLGRLEPVKDHRTLLQAFALVRANRPCRLLMMGPGPLREELRALADDLGVGPDVELGGFVDNPYGILARADAFVLSSRNEALPTALVEALACGCPPASTDCKQGPREILLDGELGPLSEVGSPESLARAMEEVLDAPVSRESLVHRSQDFTFARSAEAYRSLAYGEGEVPYSENRSVTDCSKEI